MKRNLLRNCLVALTAMMGVSTAWAANPDLENDYTLVKSVTWGDGVNIAGSGACAHTAYDTGNKKQQSLTILTAPEDAAGWIAMQAWTDGSGKGWWNRADNGLYCKSAGRSACVFGDDLTTGWLVVFECTQAASNVMSLTNGSGDPDGTFSYVASEDGKTYFCTITAAENAYVGFCGNRDKGYISKISVYKPNKAAVATTYTVSYVDMDGNTLKDAVTYDAVGGAAINLSDADKANITVGDDTYVYDSDNSEGMTVAEDGSSVVTVKFHKAQNFNYTVNEVCANTIARTTTNFSYETATIIAPYRKYNTVEGQLFTKDATNKEYNHKFTLTQEGQVENLDYSAVDGVNNVVFLTEGEDVLGLTPCNTANTGIRSSNSASAFATEDTKIVTLSAGTYKLHAIIYDASKNPDSHWIFMAGETEIADFNCTVVNIQEFDSEEFTLTEETNVILKAAGNNSMGLDALYIVGNGEAITEGEDPQPEDYTNYIVNADLTGTDGWDAAGTKGIDGSGIVKCGNDAIFDFCQTIVDLPAGQYKLTAQAAFRYTGEEQTEYEAIQTNNTITKYAELYATVGENTSSKLVMNRYECASETDYAAGDGSVMVNNLYVPNSSNAVKAWFAAGQYVNELTFINEKAGDVIIGIKKTEHNNAGDYTVIGPWTLTRTGDVVVDGIETVKAEKAPQQGIYTLAGQRVAQAVKGLYIINGKKVVVK